MENINVNIIHKSIKKTNIEHKELTDYNIMYAPEYLITVNITKNLKQLQNISYVYMEWNIKDLLSSDSLNISNIRDGKCDICAVFNDNTNALIEIKNTITQKGAKLQSIYKDIERIATFINHENDLFNLGYVVFIVKSNSKDNVIKKANVYISFM